MKNKKILLTALGSCALLTPAIAGFATSCGANSGTQGKSQSVSTWTEFKNAMQDVSVGTIKLLTNIDIPVPTNDDACLTINRNLTIDGGEGYTIQSKNESTTNFLSLIKIVKPTLGNKPLTIRFKNLNLNFTTTASYNSVIRIYNAASCTLNIDNCNINSVYSEENGTTYRNYYGISIDQVMTKGCTINIKQSQIRAWAAIMNRGSNVKLTSNQSTFIGTNHYNDDCATIIQSQFPFWLASGGSLYCSACANNEFHFVDSQIMAFDATKITTPGHQTLVENRSQANNILYLDKKTANKSCGLSLQEDDVWFCSAYTNAADITDANITAYRQKPDSSDLPPEIDDAADYNQYYSVAKNNLSRMYLDGDLLPSTVGSYHCRYAEVLDNHNWDWQQ